MVLRRLKDQVAFVQVIYWPLIVQLPGARAHPLSQTLLRLAVLLSDLQQPCHNRKNLPFGPVELKTRVKECISAADTNQPRGVMPVQTTTQQAGNFTSGEQTELRLNLMPGVFRGLGAAFGEVHPDNLLVYR